MLTENSIKIIIFTILLIISSSSSVIGDIKDIDEDSLTILNTHHWNDNQTKNKERNNIQNNLLMTNLTVFPNAKQYQSKNIAESLVKMLPTIFDKSSMIKIYKEIGINKQTSGNENYDNYEYIKFQGSSLPLLQFGYSKNVNHNQFPPNEYPNYKFLALIQSLINKFYESNYLLKETKNYSKRNENSTKPSNTDTKKILTRDFSNNKKFLFNQVKNKIIFRLKNMIKTEKERKQMINTNDRYRLDIFSELNDDNSKVFASPELKILLRKPILQDNLMNYPIKKIITKVERYKIDYPQPRIVASKILQSSLENEDETNIHSLSNMKNGIKNSTDSITFKTNDLEKENENQENLNENSEIQNSLHFEEINNFDPIFHIENKNLLINDRTKYEASQKQFQYQFRKRENESTHKKSIREVPKHIYIDKNIFKHFNVSKTKKIGKMSHVFYPIKASIENDSKNIQENNNNKLVYKNIDGKSENFQKLDLSESVGQVNGTRTISIDSKGIFYLFPLRKLFGKYKIKNNHLKKSIIQIGDKFLSYPFNKDYDIYIKNKRGLLPENKHRMQTTHFGLKENLIFKKLHSNIHPHIRNKRSLKLKHNILADRKGLLDIHTLPHLNHNVSNPNHQSSDDKHLIRSKEEGNKIDQIKQALKIRNLFNEHRSNHSHEVIKDHLLNDHNIIHFHRGPKDHNLHLLKDHGSVPSLGGHKEYHIHLLKDHSNIHSHRGPKDHNLHLLKEHGSIHSLGGHKEHHMHLLKDHSNIHSHRGPKDHNLHLLKEHGSIHSLGGHRDHNLNLLKEHSSIHLLGGHKDHNLHLLKDHSNIHSQRGPKNHNIHLLKHHIGIHPHGIIKDDNVNLFKDHKRNHPHGVLKDQKIQLLKDHISTDSHGLIKNDNVHLFKDNKRNHPHGVLKIHKSTHPHGVIKDHMNLHRRLNDDIGTYPHRALKDHNIQLFKDHGTFRNAMTKNPFSHNFRSFEHSEDGNYFKIGNHMISDGKFNHNQMNLDSFSHLEKFIDPSDFNSHNFKEIHYDDFSKGFHDCKIDENYYDFSKAWQDDGIRENIDYILLMSLNELIQTYFPVLSEILSFGLMIQPDDSNYNINPMVFQCSKWHPSGITFNFPVSQDETQTKFFLILFPNWDNYLSNIEKFFKSIKKNQSSVVNEESNISTTTAPEITEHENATTSDAIDKVNDTISNSETNEENPENPKPFITNNEEVDKESESNPLSKILSGFFKNAEQLNNNESIEKFISELKFLAKSERDNFVDKLEKIVNKLKENTEDSESSNPKEDTKVKEEENENPEENSSTKEENEDAMEIISQENM